MFDVIVANGEIVDGQRTPRYLADIGIRGDRIVQLGRLEDASSKLRIDAQGHVVSPGFVDVHNHSDGWMLKTRCLVPKVLQGFTTEVLMADGVSYAPVRQDTAPQWLFYLRGLNGLQMDDYRGWESLGEYMQQLHERTVQNVAAHVPYSNVRSLVCGFGRRSVDGFQQRQIQFEIQRGMQEGAVGLSTGLDYIVQFDATTEELVDACRAVAPHRGLYATHIRYKRGLLPGLQEAVEIGRRAEVPVHVSHLKAPALDIADEVLAYLESASRDVDITFDIYPYQPGSTMLSYLLPYEVWEDGPLAAMNKLQSTAIRRRFREGIEAYGFDWDRFMIAWLPSRDNADLQGKPLSAYIEDSGFAAEDAICNLLLEERLAVLCIVVEGTDELVEPFVRHPLGMIGSDGIFFPDGVVHPRVYGTVGRVLGPCVRDKRLFSLEDAVYKLSGFPAQRFGLADRGLVREGCYADLVIFDSQTITDPASFEEPHQPTIGVRDVLVNGTPILRDGRPLEDLTEPLPGRFLRRGQS